MHPSLDLSHSCCLCSCLCSPPLSCRHSTDQLKLILTRAFPKCPTPRQDHTMYSPIHSSKRRYLRINITQKSRGSPNSKRNPPPGPWLPRQRRRGPGGPQPGGQETVPGPFVVAGHVCYQGLSRDSLTLCRRRRTTARARPSASQPALFGWPHAAGSNLNPPSPFSSTRLRPHPRSYLTHSRLFPSYSSHSSPIFRTVSYFFMSFFTLP